MSDGAVARVKRDLRQRLLAARVGLFQAAPDAGAAIRDNFLDAIDPPTGATVAAYWPMGAEADPRPLFEALGARGHPLALPVVVRAGQPLAFRAWAPGDPLVPAGFGTSVPASTSPELVPDVLLVPLLAFDRRGHRLGYGGGFYDRTIAALAPRLALTAGIAFAGQEVDDVPTEGFDRRLDRVVTEREVVICRP